jgi:hypothetical protein
MDLPVDRELERMRERKRRQVNPRAGVTQDVERREGTDADEQGAS